MSNTSNTNVTPYGTFEDVDEIDIERDANLSYKDIQIENRDVIEKYDKWQSGEITFDDYSLFVLGKLKYYIKHIISVKNRRVSGEEDDLMQDGFLAVLAELRRYDPRGTMITSFFHNYIVDGTKGSLKNPMSEYYVKMATFLNKIARENGFVDMNDPKLNPVLFSQISGKSIKTIEEVRKQVSFTSVSMESIGDNVKNENYLSPEDQYIKNEDNKFVYTQLGRLNSLERMLVENITMASGDEKKSIRCLRRALEDESFRSLFPEIRPEDKVDQNYIQRKLNGAIRKIKYSSVARRLGGEEKEKEYEQADVCDMRTFMAAMSTNDGEL